jgi:uncharacterized protein YbjT (DUF2867 family)
MLKMYLVTGATGHVGSEVVAQLLATGKKVRVFARDVGKVAHWAERVQVAAGDFRMPETLARASSDVEAVFVMNGNQDPETFARLVAAAKTHGAPRIVFLSTILADMPQMKVGQLHKQMEDAIRESGLRATFIRPGGFMSNACQWIGTIRSESVVYNPMGEGKSAPIAPEDIAAVAVRALTDQDLCGEVFEITGGELLSVPEQVDALARALGKPIRCVDVPVQAAVNELIRAGIPAQMAEAVGQSLEAVRDGRAAVITETVAKVTGRPPKTFATWAREHASLFS